MRVTFFGGSGSFGGSSFFADLDLVRRTNDMLFYNLLFKIINKEIQIFNFLSSYINDSKYSINQCEKKDDADEARAAGMCPGAFNNGCKQNNPAVIGRIYCAICQERGKNNGAAVQESHRKQTERSKEIKVTIPFYSQLSTLGSTRICALLSESTRNKLQVSNVVGVDTAAANRSVESKYMYIVGAYYADATGDNMAFWANRSGSDEDWLSARWNNVINNQGVQGGNIFVMLDSFVSFAAGRQIVFSTGNNPCNYKRLTSAYLWSPEIANPFPHSRYDTRCYLGP